MHTITRTSTTEMEVTSIRLERELKERLKDLSGGQGYQALIRDILWNYVRQKSGDSTPHLTSTDIRATFSAKAQQEGRCAITGQILRPGDAILLGLLHDGTLVPLYPGSLA